MKINEMLDDDLHYRWGNFVETKRMFSNQRMLKIITINTINSVINIFFCISSIIIIYAVTSKRWILSWHTRVVWPNE